MKALIQTGSSLSACGHAQAGGRVPVPLKSDFLSIEPVNISAGRRISIRELAETVKKTTGFTGEIVWDTTQPDGQMDKIFAVSRLNSLGLSCDTPLEDGLRRTVQWFLKARNEESVRL